MIVDMNMVSMLIADLNKELFYKMTQTREMPGEAEDYDFLVMVTNGEHVTIKFIGMEIFSSQNFKRFENMTPTREIHFFERENFEPHLRLLIQDEINVLQQVMMK